LFSLRVLLFLNFIYLVINSSHGQYPDSIQLNDIRFIASHNSYKKKPDPKVIHFLNRFKKRLGEELDPKRMDFGHLSLTEQFDQYEVRGIELDVYYDPKGGKYRKRRVNLFNTGKKQRVKDAVMKQPGFKLLHIADIDYETNYLTFKQALKEIRLWSDSHVGHTPLFINIEPKEENPGDYSSFLRFLGFKKAAKFDSTAYSCLENEIFSTLNRTSLFTPSDLQGSYSSVSERLDQQGWPLLNEVLGKIIFVVDDDGKGQYKESKRNPLMFVYGEPSDSTTAFVKRNDPVGKEQEISLLTEKYIVRTRTDVETIHARENDYSMFYSALASQAQIISTDYYKPDEGISSFQINLSSWKSMIEWPFILRFR
jgi:hypothetical protein